MSKVLAVFGATGTQGGSVIDFVLNDEELSKSFKIHAITRDVYSDKAKKLAANHVEVVPGDMDSEQSIESALRGVNTVFIMTTPMTQTSFGTIDAEYNTAKRIADVAVKAGVEYIIYSTLPGPLEISGGKYTKITPFDAKAEAQKYIASLPIKSAFVSLGSFMENFVTQVFLSPQKAADGTFHLLRNVSAASRMPLIAATKDTGKFVGAILAHPDEYEGKTFKAANRLYTMDEIAAAMSLSSGKTIVHKQVSTEAFSHSLAGSLPPDFADIFAEGGEFYAEYDYFGPGAEDDIAWAVENARGNTVTLAEFFEENPFTFPE